MKVWEELVNDLTNRGQWYLNKSFIYQVDPVMNRIKVDSPGPCGKAHWMSMPTTGDLMANALNTPVFFFSQFYSQLFFPCFSAPNDNPPIFIALIASSSHFVVVQLKDPDLFPAPQVINQWRQNAVPEALA